MENKYYWSFDGEAECWYDCGASIQDCIDQAIDAAQDDTCEYAEYKTVFIGEAVPFSIADNLDVCALLENLEQSAFDFCGAAAEGWDTFNPRKPTETQELQEAIAPVVIGWLEKYGRAPHFSAIENVAEYDLYTGNRVGYGG